jgi:hypothetical protein
VKFICQLSVLPNIRLIESSRMRLAGLVARMGKGEVHRQFLMEYLKVGRSSRKWESNIKMGRKVIGLVGRDLNRSVSELGQLAGCCDKGNELSGSIKCREFLD